MKLLLPIAALFIIGLIGQTVISNSGGSGGGSTSPGGSNTAIQFNDSSLFGGDSTNLSYNKSTHILSVSGGINTGSGTWNIVGNNGTDPCGIVASGTDCIFFNSANSQHLSRKDSAGTVHDVEGGGGGGTTKGVASYETTAYSGFSLNTYVAVTFDSNGHDDFAGAMHSTSTNTSRFIAQNTGWHQATCGLTMSDSAQVGISFKLNGTTFVLGTQQQVIGAGGSNVTSSPIYMSTNDYVECMAYITSGSGIPYSGNVNSYAAAMRLIQLP